MCCFHAHACRDRSKLTALAGGHANIVRFMRMNNVIEVYVFEPHGTPGKLPDWRDWHTAAQHFGELVTITLQSAKLLHKVVVGEQTCPRLQKELQLCAMYVMYFAVLNHVLPSFGVQTSFQAIADLCNLQGSRFTQGSVIGHMRTRILNLSDQPVQPHHTCTHDIVILMLLGFFGTGDRKLHIATHDERPNDIQIKPNEDRAVFLERWNLFHERRFRDLLNGTDEGHLKTQAMVQLQKNPKNAFVSAHAIIHHKIRLKTLSNLFDDCVLSREGAKG